MLAAAETRLARPGRRRPTSGAGAEAAGPPPATARAPRLVVWPRGSAPVAPLPPCSLSGPAAAIFFFHVHEHLAPAQNFPAPKFSRPRAIDVSREPRLRRSVSSLSLLSTSASANAGSDMQEHQPSMGPFSDPPPWIPTNVVFVHGCPLSSRGRLCLFCPCTLRCSTHPLPLARHVWSCIKTRGLESPSHMLAISGEPQDCGTGQVCRYNLVGRPQS